MGETQENQALHLLGQVMNDSKGENIVALGMVKNIKVNEGKIDCIIEFDGIDVKKNDKIFNTVFKIISKLSKKKVKNYIAKQWIENQLRLKKIMGS